MDKLARARFAPVKRLLDPAPKDLLVVRTAASPIALVNDVKNEGSETSDRSVVIWPIAGMIDLEELKTKV